MRFISWKWWDLTLLRKMRMPFSHLSISYKHSSMSHLPSYNVAFYSRSVTNASRNISRISDTGSSYFYLKWSYFVMRSVCTSLSLLHCFFPSLTAAKYFALWPPAWFQPFKHILSDVTFLRTWKLGRYCTMCQIINTPEIFKKFRQNTFVCFVTKDTK